MANEFKLAYANTGQIDITAQVFRGNPLVALEDPAVALTEDVAGIYAGDTDDCTLAAGDLIVYYDGAVIIGSEIHQPEVDADVDTLITANASIVSILSGLVVVDTNVDTIASDLLIADGNIDSILSDLIIVDTSIDATKVVADTIASDLLLVSTTVDIIASDLLIVDTNIDTIASDLITADTAIDSIASDLLVTGTVVDEIASDLALLDTSVIASDLVAINININSIASDLIITDDVIDTIASDLLIIDTNLDGIETTIHTALDSYANKIDWMADLSTLEADMLNVIALLTAIPIEVFPAPTINLATIKIILQIEGTDEDARLTILIPIIEDIVTSYCGVSSISDLTVGVVFPIAGLCKYAMENPIGAKLAQVGSNRTEYGEFPSTLLKLLDYFKSDTTGGDSDAQVINLLDINVDLGK